MKRTTPQMLERIREIEAMGEGYFDNGVIYFASPIGARISIAGSLSLEQLEAVVQLLKDQRDA